MVHRSTPFHSLAPAHLSLIVALLASATWAPTALAKDADSRWSLGLGVATIDKVYRDYDREILPLPLVSYESERFSIGIPVSDFKLYSTHALSFRLRARFSNDGYEADDSPFLAGMSDRKFSLWAGGAVVWHTHLADISAEFLADALGNSKGTRAKVQMDRRFAAGKFGITPRIAAEWLDDKYVDYYYGVKQSEVRAGRAFHEGKSTTNLQVGLRVDYMPARTHLFFLDVGSTRVGSGIEASPLVDTTRQTSLGLGYVHRF